MKKSTKSNAPKLVIVSEGIRRDLHQPLRYFRRIRVFHLYSQASYADMKPIDYYNPKAVKFQGMFDLYRKIAQISPDILQTAEPWANRIALKITFVCFGYALFNQVKLIFPVFENRPFKEKFSAFEKIFLFWWGKMLSQRAQKIFYLNQGAKRNLLAIGAAKEKMLRINWGTWGIDFNDFNSQGKPKAWDKIYDPLILFVGKVSTSKGAPWLLKAFSQLQKKIPKAKLYLAGPLENEQLLINIKSIPNTKYLGIIKNQDLPQMFRRATITVAPSITTRAWEEQVGMVNLQSMACGTPVISTYSGAIAEYIQNQNGCLLVQEKNARELAIAMKKFLTDKNFYSFQVEKALLWSRQYDVKANIKRIENILLDL